MKAAATVVSLPEPALRRRVCPRMSGVRCALLLLSARCMAARDKKRRCRYLPNPGTADEGDAAHAHAERTVLCRAKWRRACMVLRA